MGVDMDINQNYLQIKQELQVQNCDQDPGLGGGGGGGGPTPESPISDSSIGILDAEVDVDVDAEGTVEMGEQQKRLEEMIHQICPDFKLDTKNMDILLKFSNADESERQKMLWRGRQLESWTAEDTQNFVEYTLLKRLNFSRLEFESFPISCFHVEGSYVSALPKEKFLEVLPSDRVLGGLLFNEFVEFKSHPLNYHSRPNSPLPLNSLPTPSLTPANSRSSLHESDLLSSSSRQSSSGAAGLLPPGPPSAPGAFNIGDLLSSQLQYTNINPTILSVYPHQVLIPQVVPMLFRVQNSPNATRYTHVIHTSHPDLTHEPPTEEHDDYKLPSHRASAPARKVKKDSLTKLESNSQPLSKRPSKKRHSDVIERSQTPDDKARDIPIIPFQRLKLYEPSESNSPSEPAADQERLQPPPPSQPLHHVPMPPPPLTTSSASLSADSSTLNISLSMDLSNIGGGGGGSSSAFQNPTIRLWKFFVDCLKDPRLCPSYIRWLEVETGEFEIKDTTKIAKLWGSVKGKDQMDYAKMARGIRYGIKAGHFRRPLGGKIDKVLIFNEAIDWRTRFSTDNSESVLQRLDIETPVREF